MAYPGSIPTIATNKTNATTAATDHPAHHNQLALELNATMTELGVAPSGAFTDVAARFTDIETTIAASAGDPQVASYVVYRVGSNFFARSPIGLTAVGSNADCGAVITSCLNNINATTSPRGLIQFAPNTTFVYSSIPSMRRTYASGGADDMKDLIFEGTGGSVISLQTGGERFIDFNRQADYDGFCGLIIRNLEFDGNNVTGNHHRIMGTRSPGSNIAQRCDFRRLTIQKCKLYNVLAGSAGNVQLAVWLQPSHVSTGETQTVCEDILIDGLHMRGGDACFAIIPYNAIAGGSPNWTGTKIRGDNIMVRNVDWDWGLNSIAYASTGNQIGGAMFGERLTVENVKLRGSADACLEINNFRTITCRDCSFSDAGNEHFFIQNFNWVNGTDATEQPTQAILYDNCTVTWDYDVWAAATTPSRGFQFHADFADIGTITMRNCKTIAKVVQTFVAGHSLYLPNKAFRIGKLVLDGCDFDSFANNASGSSINVQPIMFDEGPRQFVCRDTKITCRGARSGAGAYFVKAMYLSQQQASETELDVEMVLDDKVTGKQVDTTTALYLTGGGTTSRFWGRVRAKVIMGSDTWAEPINVAASTAVLISPTLFAEGDNSGVTNGPAVTVGDATNSAKVHAVRTMEKTTTLAPITFTPGASTVTAQYAGLYHGLMSVTGGTVTLVEVSSDNSTYVTVAAATNCSFNIENGWWVRLTYSVLPTCRVLPRR